MFNWFPMIFLWFPIMSYAFLWFSYDFPMILLWFPMIFLWFPMILNATVNWGRGQAVGDLTHVKESGFQLNERQHYRFHDRTPKNRACGKLKHLRELRAEVRSNQHMQQQEKAARGRAAHHKESHAPHPRGFCWAAVGRHVKSEQANIDGHEHARSLDP